MALTEKTYIKLTLVTLCVVLMFIIGWTVSATTWKVNMENTITTNALDIKRIDTVQHVDSRILTEMSIDIKWIKQKLEENK